MVTRSIRCCGIWLSVVVAVIGIGHAPAHAAAVSWAVDHDGSWQDAPNWTSSPNLPGPADDVTIDRSPADVTVSYFSTQGGSIRSLICGETLIFGLGELTIAEASQINGALNLTGGNLTGSGDLVVTGHLTWTSGSMTGTGTTQIAPSGTMTVSGSGLQYLGRNFVNAGLVTLSGTGTFSSLGSGAGPVFDNQAGATFTIAGDQGLSQYIGSVPLLKNEGTLQKTGGSGTSTIEWTVNNAGTVSVQSGTLALVAGGASSGTLQIASNAVLSLSGAYDLSGAAVSNLGLLRIAGTVSGNPTIDAAGGETQVTSGSSLTAKRIRQSQLTIGASAAVVIAATAVPNAPDSTSRLGGLEIAGGAAPTASLDLNHNSLIIDYTGPLGSRLSDLTAQIHSGRNGRDANDQANWNGPGIITSKGRQDNVAFGVDRYNLGAINNADLDTVGIGAAYTTFAGQAVAPNTILVKYTYSGDANLDGKVDGDDYSYWLNGFLGSTDPSVQGWLRGDFNYDGRVDADDYTQWLNSFLQGGPPLGDPAGPQPVPEPASVTLLVLATLCLLRLPRCRR